jgi:broad specificity phosphatase PhoE
MTVMRIAVLLLLLPFAAQADEALWSALKGGGQVVFIRHAITTPGVGDPPGFELQDCATQRNLTEAGRAHARRIGAEFRKRGIPVGRVLSSPWCRCIETAKLAFGKSRTDDSLSNLFGRPENRERQVEQMKKLLVREKANLILVSHGSTIVALTGVSPAPGEAVVVTPENAYFRLAGRLLVD